MIAAVISTPLMLILLGWGLAGFINEITGNRGDKFDNVQTA